MLDSPNIFPKMGVATRFVLFHDYERLAERPNAASWTEDFDAIVAQGLSGIALRAIRDHGLVCNDDILGGFRAAAFASALNTSRVIERSGDILQEYRNRKIPFLVTKGLGIAMHYPSLVERPFSDIDILVRPDDYEAAYAIAGVRGMVENTADTVPWNCFHRFCQEATNLRGSDGASIDLHHHISPWNWSLGVSFDELYNGRRDVERAGHVWPLAATKHNLLIAALHVVSDQSRPGETLRIWRDLLQLLSACDVDDVVDTAERWNLAPWLRWITTCLPEECRPMDLARALTSCTGEIPARRRLIHLLQQSPGQRDLRSKYLRIPLGNAVLHTVGTMFPSSRYLHSRYPNTKSPRIAWLQELSKRTVPRGGAVRRRGGARAQ
jgi:hypothetical protein